MQLDPDSPGLESKTETMTEPKHKKTMAQNTTTITINSKVNAGTRPTMPHVRKKRKYTKLI